MMRLLRKLSGGVAVGDVSPLFFVLYYLYLWRVIDLRLIRHGGGIIWNFPVFYKGWEFFRESVFQPGGLVEYVSAFLAQFFYIGWAGALVATAQAWLLWLCTGTIIRAISSWRLQWVRFILPIALLIFYARYSYPFGTAMALLAALGFVCLYMGTSSKKRPTNFLVFLALSIILYATAGGAYLLFVVVCGICELFFRRRPVLGLSFLLSALIIAYIGGTGVFNISINDVFKCFMPSSYDEYSKDILVMVYALYLLLPLALVGLEIAQLLAKFKGMSHGGAGAVTAASETAEKSERRQPARTLASSARKAGAMLAPLLICVLVVHLFHSDRQKTLMAVDYYACNGMWPQVLQASARYPHSKFINHSANRALYHTGRLANDMFMYGQQIGALMLSAETRYPMGRWKSFDTYIDLGHINMAEYRLAAVMDTYGEQPIVLRRLALINMVKGNTGAARVYLGALSKTLFDAGWARGYLERIERDPNLSTDAEIQYLRSMMPAADGDFKSPIETVFLDLLDSNRHNQMAFEYLMAYYLLTEQLDKFVQHIGRLNDFNYPEIPRPYEEAILVYTSRTHMPVELHGRRIRPESHQRFKGFEDVLARYMGNKEMAFNELAEDYGDSYLFYYVYGFSRTEK